MYFVQVGFQLKVWSSLTELSPVELLRTCSAIHRAYYIQPGPELARCLPVRQPFTIYSPYPGGSTETSIQVQELG